MAAPGRGVVLSLVIPRTQPEAGGESAIRQLPADVANAIAAGEVIERPASVVKELVENSIDAGAARIAVQIEDGGVELIRVIDDGRGMRAAELGLAFERHATSKLRDLDDLSRIATFGFRGEALASIAAVSEVVLVSRVATDPAGAKLEVVGQMAGTVDRVGAPPGTVVEVRQLFKNVPARRAFLRSSRAEGSACLRVVAEAALARPDVRFEFHNGSRRLLGTTGDGSLVSAAQAVMGRGTADRLVPVHWSSGEIAVVGVLGTPGAAHPTRNSLVLMVNGRRVHQRALIAAVESAYRGLLEVGRHPLAVLDIRCDPSQVDVNVHPTKRQVRFLDESRFFEAVQHACWNALKEVAPASLVTTAGPSSVESRAAVSWSGLERTVALGTGLELDLGDDEASQPGGENSLAGADRWRYLGQAHNRYLVVETDHGVALLDQHAAHEKVLYAKVLEGLRGAGAGQAGQGLLSPMLLEVGPAVVAALIDSGDLFRRAGFDLEVFGEGTVRCSAVPIGTRLSELEELLSEVLVGLEEGVLTNVPGDRAHRLAASVACHSALRFGDSVSREEVISLLRDLARTPGGITCPHGRPAVLILSAGQLLSAFRRGT